MASFIISAAVYAYFRSFTCWAVSFLSGIFIDVDHILDYYLNYGWPFNVKNFRRFCNEVKFNRLTLFFHSYEVIALLWISIFAFSLGNVWIALAIGLTQHLVFDVLTNRDKLKKRSYFLVFRMLNRFRKERIVREWLL